MLEAGVGQSSNTSTNLAVQEAAKQAMDRLSGKADIVVMFATTDHLPGLQHSLRSLGTITGTSEIVGCSGLGVLTGEEESEGTSGVAVMAMSSDVIRAHPFLHDSLRDHDGEVGAQIAQKLAAHRPSVIAMLTDGYNCRPEALLAGLEQQEPFTPLVGAAASENGSVGQTCQFYGDRVVTNGVTGFALSGSLRAHIDITQGCQPVGQPMTITRAQGNLILEIDGRPAFEVFHGIIGKPFQQDLRRALAFVFVGLPPDPSQTDIQPGQYLVRNIIGLDPDKGILAVGQNVAVGQPMIFTLRDGQRAREDLEQMLQRQRQSLAGRAPRMALYFNCCARGSSLYGIPGIDTAYIKNALGDVPMVGFFGNFELGPLAGRNHLLTYTGVLALITEEKPLRG
jgi:small ligand-binding sensory domain FIST